jgi:hypothetical protein
MPERVSDRQLARDRIIHLVFGAQRVAVPGRIVKGRCYRLRADIQDDARFILLWRVYRLAIVEIARSEFKHERIGGIAQGGPVEYRTVGCR